jgi:hypothetical protein
MDKIIADFLTAKMVNKVTDELRLAPLPPVKCSICILVGLHWRKSIAWNAGLIGGETDGLSKPPVKWSSG